MNKKRFYDLLELLTNCLMGLELTKEQSETLIEQIKIRTRSKPNDKAGN